MRALAPFALALALFAVACSGGDAPEEAPDATPEATADATPEPAATPAPAPAAPEMLAASHILVQWKGSMRAKASITRTKEEALARANEVLAKVTGGADFGETAKEYSDGPSGPKGGDLGSFPAGRMIPEFSAAVVKAEVESIVAEPVETSFGYHIIRRNKLPPMYGARHILVQYKGSMRANPTITRTKEEAMARANEALTKAKDGGDFAALAAEYSDGPTKTKGGDLGTFPGGTMHPDFQKGVESVEANTLVPDLVETPFGYHLIFRTQ